MARRVCTHEDGRRVRVHARTLRGRVFLAGGEVILVRESPDPDALFDVVTGWTARPEEDPTPGDLGVPGASTPMIGRSGLATRSRAVQQWRAEVEWRLAGRAAFSEKATLRDELAEIDRLARVVVDLHRLMAEPARGVSPYWLPPAEEEAHAEAIRRHCGGKTVTRDVAWLARLTHWLTGRAGLGRFLTTVSGGLRTPAEHQGRDALERFRAAVAHAIEALGESRLGSKKDVRPRITRAMREADGWTLFAPIRKAHSGLPARFLAADALGLPGRDSEIDLDELLTRCDRLIRAEPAPPSWECLAAVAAVYWTDGSTIPLSWAAATRSFCNNHWIRWARRNADAPGYDALLANLDVLSPGNLSDSMRFLAAGMSVDDINWFHKQDWSGLMADHTPATLAPFRRIVDWLAAAGRGPSSNEADAFWDAVATEAGRGVAGALAGFLDGLSSPTPQQSGEVIQLIRILSVPSFRRPLVDRLVAWGAPPSRPKLPPDCPENLPDGLLNPLRKMAFYQRLAGEPARVPDSIRKPLDAVSRAEAEARYLRTLGEVRDARQAERLRRLEARAAAEIPVERLLRKAREVTALAALAAARGLVRREVDVCWRERFGAEFGEWDWQEAAQLLHWVDSLEDEGRRMVRTILEGHREHGGSYRRHLPHNAEWLARAAGAIRLDAWLDPPAETVTLKDGKTARIRVAADPRDVFLMGSRFNTCLGLRDGCNRDSVLANAADANKAVLYAFGPDGRPIARKLVGVTSGWELVGFRLYCHDDAEALRPAFDAYCGAWAARAGLRLADEGVPERLGRTFWYDDGADAWNADARAALDAHPPEDRPTPPPEGISPLDRLHEAIRAGDLAALAELPAQHAGDQWLSAAVFWRLRLGGAPEEKAFEDVNQSRLFEHLAATGSIRPPIDPTRWPIRPGRAHALRNDVAGCLFSYLPPDRDRIESGWELAMRYDEGADFEGSYCFHTCEISPALAALPFRRVAALLRRYADWFPASRCDCGADLRGHWARILQLAWLRDPDPAQVGRLLVDPRPVLREIARKFVEIQPDRNLQYPLRRLARSLTDDAHARDALASLRSRLDAAASAGGRAGESEIELESIAVAPGRPLPDRLAAVERLAVAGGEVGLDASLASLLCSAWDADDRARLSPAARRAAAASLARGVREQAWRIWPLLYWLAAMDVDDRSALLLEMIPEHEEPGPLAGLARILADEYPSAQVVLLQARRHRDASIRIAADDLHATLARHRPALAAAFDRETLPWLGPAS